MISMKSYALAVAVAMLAAAGYVFQNAGEVTVRFLMWERQMPQGVWDVFLFASGALLMWLVSFLALLEVRTPLKRQIADMERERQELREEKAGLIRALENVRRCFGNEEHQPLSSPECEVLSEDETVEIYAVPVATPEEGPESSDLCLECEPHDGALADDGEKLSVVSDVSPSLIKGAEDFSAEEATNR